VPLLHFGKKRRKSVVPMPRAVEMFAEISNTIASEEASKRAAAPRRPWRSALLATALAVGALLGTLVRSPPTLGFVQIRPEASSKSATADANALRVEVAALKASVETVMRNDNTQLAKMADRLAQVERASKEPTIRLTRIAQAVDRLEKTAAAAKALEKTRDTNAKTADALPPESNTSDKVIDGWTVQDVQHGRAVVESRDGGVIVVAPALLFQTLAASKRSSGRMANGSSSLRTV
jgi:hypothetical protein